jgi:hypothetical protein
MDQHATISVRTYERLWAAINVVIRETNVYVNYFARDGSKHCHTSYHESGQRHAKTENGFVRWTGGPSGCWVPMKQFRTAPAKVDDREQVSTVGWQVSEIAFVLPLVPNPSEMVVDASNFSDASILALEVSIVGPSAGARPEITGFPVLQRYRMHDKIIVEIEAFLLTE